MQDQRALLSVRTLAVGLVLLAGTAALTLYDYDPAPERRGYSAHDSGYQTAAQHPVAPQSNWLNFSPNNNTPGDNNASSPEAAPTPDALTVGADRLTATMPESQAMDPASSLENGLDVSTWKVATPPILPEIKMPKPDAFLGGEANSLEGDDPNVIVTEDAAETKRRERQRATLHLATPLVPTPSPMVIP